MSKTSSHSISGQIVALSISEHKGEKKTSVPLAKLQANFGLLGDAHAGTEKRQVSLLTLESIEACRIKKGLPIHPGDFAENITVKGIDLQQLNIGDQLGIGKDVVLEITQKGKTCHSRCGIFQKIGDCVMPREGIFAKVINGGELRPGDEIRGMNIIPKT